MQSSPSRSQYDTPSANYYMDELESSQPRHHKHLDTLPENEGVMLAAGGDLSMSISSTWDDAVGLSSEGNDDQVLQSIQQRKLHRAYSRHRCIKWSLIGILGVVAVVVLAPVVVKTKQSRDGATESTPSISSLFWKPPSDNLSSFCAPSYVETEGYQKCQQLCEPSACCYIPADLEGSCQDGDHASDCQVYQEQCVILAQPHAATTAGEGGDQRLPDDDGVTDDPDYADKHIQPAPDDMAQVCSVSNLETLDGMRACAKECIQAHCCYDDEFSNCRSEQPNCKGYEPCFNLKEKLAGRGGGRGL